MRVVSELKDYDRFFLRKLLGWVCREVEVSHRKVKLVTFGPTNRIWSCRGNLLHFKIELSPEMQFPYRYRKETFADPVEFFVYMAGWLIGSAGRISPPKSAAKICLTRFRKDRPKLFQAWIAPEKIRPKKPSLSLVETRKKKVEEALRSWERKFRLAKTKVAKYKKKLAYYEKKISQTGGQA